MIIYTSEKVSPYTYKVENPLTGEFYIGYRSANKIPSHLDLPIYKTSSKIVKPVFDKFTWVILAEFANGEDAYDFEQQMIYEEWGNPLILNKRCYHNGNKFVLHSHTEETKSKMSVAQKLRGPVSDETRSKLSLSAKGRIPHNKGKYSSEETKEKLCDAWKLRGPVSDETRSKLSLSAKGRVVSDTHRNNLSIALKGVPQIKAECPHCNKVGGISMMKRWHFDNCKLSKQ